LRGGRPLATLAITTIPVADVSHALAANALAANALADNPLAGNAVHVWRIPVLADPALTHACNGLLTAAELHRGKRYTRDEDRLRYQLGRAAMRCLLARYLGVPPKQIGLEANQAGKPQLDADTLAHIRADIRADTRGANSVIHFNLSHSGHWVMAAFARSFAVGIDVEALSAKSASDRVIEYVLSDRELQVLRGLPQHKQTAAFFKAWTSKEAFVKGIGVGLAAGLKTIEVSVDPDQPARLVSAPPEHRPDLWQLQTLEFSEDYAATLALALPPAAAPQILDVAVDNAHHVLEH
jgi:4'-phosphopantetheinyl transferase